jgi:hypothetical protein
MKIWLDDIRTPPDDSWTWVKNWDEVETLLKTGVWPDEMSFDHDLGEDTKDGYDIIKMIGGFYSSQFPKVVHVHSANPVGAKNIRDYDEWVRRVILTYLGERVE